MRRLLVFGKEPRPGAVKTRLAARIGAEAACRLYRAFLADLGAACQGLEGVAVEWWVDGDPAAFRELAPTASFFLQSGRDLGERLSMAFGRAFSLGSGPVVSIGTDCPLLGREGIATLFARLESEPEACLIPAEDGGYVALGLARPCPQAFDRIPWSTASVLAATVSALQEAGLVVELLPALYDVDNFTDLERLAQDLRSKPDHAPRTAALLQVLGPAEPSGKGHSRL